LVALPREVAEILLVPMDAVLKGFLEVTIDLEQLS
jgi:hypothetical protein